MLKKLGIYLFIPIFLLTTGGITFNIHSCKMRGASDVSLAMHYQKSCCGSKTMDNNCCKNEVKILKITDDYSSSGLIHTTKNIAFINIDYPLFSANILENKSFQNSSYHAPPTNRHVSLSVFNCSLLI